MTGINRRIVVTVGPTSTFAYIDTPEGPYETGRRQRLRLATAHGEHDGWLRLHSTRLHPSGRWAPPAISMNCRAKQRKGKCQDADPAPDH